MRWGLPTSHPTWPRTGPSLPSPGPSPFPPWTPTAATPQADRRPFREGICLRTQRIVTLQRRAYSFSRAASCSARRGCRSKCVLHYALRISPAPPAAWKSVHVLQQRVHINVLASGLRVSRLAVLSDRHRLRAEHFLMGTSRHTPCSERTARLTPRSSLLSPSRTLSQGTSRHTP